MSKHFYATLFALVGLLVASYISTSEGKSMQFTDVIIGMGFGCFVGYFIAGLIKSQGMILQQEFTKLGDLRGLRINDITQKVGPYQEFCNCYIEDIKEWGKKYTWRQNGYTITLLFGSDELCIGVTHESANFN